jgi:hypothetical protein
MAGRVRGVLGAIAGLCKSDESLYAPGLVLGRRKAGGLSCGVLRASLFHCISMWYRY